MNNVSINNISTNTVSPYFAPLLPWQSSLWQQLTSQASGIKGIGKREFIWRWLAWQLCYQKQAETACGHCESCQWLIAGTHPDLHILPATSSPSYEQNSENEKKRSKKSTKAVNNKPSPPKIKIDDIRDIQNFVHQGSQSLRICVFDYAETMTIAAANALLKTLEEPRQGVQLILITDEPTLLLPTIKSRVQQLPFTQIDQSLANQYVQQQLALHNQNRQNQNNQSQQLLKLSGYAPLQAVIMAQSDWYALRDVWLKTWLALRTHKREPILASDYWQVQLALSEFITLTQVMLADLQRLSSNLPTHQQDIDFSVISPQNMPKLSAINQLLLKLQEIHQSLKQNVQDKLAYDMLMQSLVAV